MSIQEAKEILGNTMKELSDDEIENLILESIRFANMVVELSFSQNEIL